MTPKQFSPEAYGDFDIISDEEIAAAQEKIWGELNIDESDEWEILDDVLTHSFPNRQADPQ